MPIQKIIQGYRTIEKLGESLFAEVFKVHPKDEPEHFLVLKRLKKRAGSEGQTGFLRIQVDSLKGFDLQGVITPLNFSSKRERPFFVQKWFDGKTLSDWRKTGPEMDSPAFFKIACSLAQIVGEIHKAGFFHGGIKPNNILINPDTLSLRLIDLVRVFNINEISHFIYDEGFLTSTLPYISPEQTGRIRYDVSYGIDFYSMGAVLYELLYGNPPFTSNDPLEVIHSHLAQEPPFPKMDRDIPEVVKDIIARLLEKDPERRYQTGEGLAYDLRRCKREYRNTGEIVLFAIGLMDHASRIHIPSIMVGREREKELLLKEHAVVCSGSFRSALISGLPGIGKTRLIQELQGPIIANHGYFVSGKFDQYQENVPYSTLIQAFSELMRLYLTEERKRIEYWKETIRSAVGQNGKLLTDLIAELELIIGVQPQVVALPPAEAKNRFNDTVDRFISCLAGSEYPLTLFIDDLQWCDMATFDLIENLLINSQDHPHLFFLGAYRHNEVDAGHPLRSLLSRVTEMKTPLMEIRLNELEPAHTNEMIAYVLGASSEKTETLSGIVHAISEGNPLYVNEALTWLHENSLVYPGKEGVWQWDNEKIMKSPVPETAQELFRAKILNMPEDTLEVLQLAACLGARFKIRDLSMLTNRDQADLYRELAPVFNQRILTKGKDCLSFFHDRVQDAVDSTLDDETRRAIHARIAEAYIEAIPDKNDMESLDSIFLVVEHLNKGRSDVPGRMTRYRDARFNYNAGRKAVDSLALDAANIYFKESLALIPEDCWETEYDFTFSLYKELARSELTLGDQSRAEELLDELIRESKTDLDRADCLAEQSTNLLSLGKFQQSILVANQGLAYFGKALPENESDIIQKTDYLADAIKKSGVSPHEILQKDPVMRRKELIEITLYNQLVPAYYLTGLYREFKLVSLQATHLCISIGIHDLCISPFVTYSMHLLEIGHYEEAFSFEGLVIELCNRFSKSFGVSRGMVGLVWGTLHYRKSLGDVFNYCLRAIESGKRSGDTYHAGCAYVGSFWTLAMKGTDLKTIHDYVIECDEFSKKYNIPFSAGMAKGFLASWVEPMKGSGIRMQIKEDIAGWLQSDDFALLGNYYIFSAMAQYYLGNFKDAVYYLENGGKYLTSLTISIPNRIWHIFFVLNSLRLPEKDLSKHEIDSVMTGIKPLIEKIKLWAGFGPAFKPYAAFINAELERVTGVFSETRKLYLDAIDIAHEQEYTLLEGHIHECLGKLLWERGISQAHFHLNEAVNLYKKCHATAKMKLIMEECPEYITPLHEEKPEEVTSSQKLDTVYMMKAAGAISGELELNELLKTIMKSVMEGLGAQQGYIIMEEGTSLMVRARGVKDGTLEVFVDKEPLDYAKGISRAIVRYVQRTKEIVMLGNAMEEGPFVGNMEVQKLKLRSVLCLPILRRQKLVGIIYLQNSLIKSVFSAEHGELVSLLAAQAAISLENAGLVEDMNESEKELRESENLLRQSQELSRMVAWDWSFADDSVKWSGDVFSLFGQSAEKMLYLDAFIGSVHAEDVEKVWQEIQKSIDTTTVYRVEFRVIHPDGTVLWLMGRGGVRRDNDGRATNLAGLAMNITERKQAEKELLKSEERYRGIIDTVMDGIAIIDNNGILLDANPAYCKMLGYSYDELIGMQVETLVHPDHRHKVQDEFTALIMEKGKVQIGTVDIRKDGSPVPVEVHGVVFNYAGQDALLAIIRDITERKRSEEALVRQKEEEIRALAIAREKKELLEWLNTLETFVGKLDPDGNMFFCNEVALRGTGVTGEEVYGKYFPDMVFWSHSEKERAEIVKIFQKAKAGISSIIETNFRGADGSHIPAIFNCQPVMNEKGDVKYITAEAKTIVEQARLREELQKERESLEVRVRERTTELEDLNLELSREIAERKKVEEDLERYRDHLKDLVRERTVQLETAQEELVRRERLATLGRLTATVSHEIRNPLGTIRTSLYSISERSRGKGLGMEKTLDRAERSIVRCDRIIEELMNFTRARDLDPEPTIIDEWLDQTLNEQVIPEGITLTWKPDAGIKILLDREHFRRCLVNVIDNAGKAIEEKREKMITTGHEPGVDHLAVESRVMEDRFELLITDTGTGIPSDQLEKIFEPLFSTRGFGIGLGLSIVKQIMEKHRGGIEIESRPDIGTTVTLWLPVKNLVISGGIK